MDIKIYVLIIIITNLEKQNTISLIKLAVDYKILKDHKNAFKYYMISIKNGDEVAMYNFSHYYDETQDIQKMYDYGSYFWNDISFSETNISQMYKFGKFYEKHKDYPLMFKYYLKAESKGHILAENMLKMYHVSNNNIIKDYINGAENGDAVCMHHLAIYYQEKYDYNNTIKYFQMALQKNYIYAITDFGLFFYNQKHYLTMIKYYELAISNNHCKAMFNLAMYYMSKYEYANMLKYLEMAEKQNYLAAIHELAKYYYLIKNNYILSIKYYEKCISIINNDDNPNTDYEIQLNIELSRCYIHFNDDKALLKQFDKYIKSNNPIIMETLGHYYKHNNDIKNYIKYYTIAADHGLSLSMSILGYYYMTNNNYELMEKYLSMAATKNNDTQYLHYLINYYEDIKDYTNMQKYCYIGINLGHLHSALTLINYYSKQNNGRAAIEVYKICCEKSVYPYICQYSTCWQITRDNIKDNSYYIYRLPTFPYMNFICENNYDEESLDKIKCLLNMNSNDIICNLAERHMIIHSFLSKYLHIYELCSLILSYS
jgi:TPR repeat protein